MAADPLRQVPDLTPVRPDTQPPKPDWATRKPRPRRRQPAPEEARTDEPTTSRHVDDYA